MKTMVSGLMFKYRMMTDMVKSLKSFATTMNKGFGKVNKKKKGAGESGQTEAQRRIAQRKAELGVQTAPASDTSAAGGSAGGNYDDLL